jgi:TPR repeat protein
MRFRSIILIVPLASLVAFLPTMAHAEKRIALVIGNKDYKTSVGPLANPLNDIHLVSDALKSVGFEVLTPVENATRTDMLRAVYALAASLRSAGRDAVGFLYYSGHGAASQGENYLIPIDVTEPSTEQLNIQGVKQSEVLKILRDEAPNAAHYLVLDACRNNLQGARGGKGFVAVEQQDGVLVAFSTAPGKTAQDTGSASGPYAAALAAELTKPTEPGENDLNMFHHVRVGVIDRTKGDQVPWFEDGIQRRSRPIFAAAPIPTLPAAASTTSEAAQAWTLAQSTTSQAVLEEYIKRYGDSFYGALARDRLEELKKRKIAVVPPPMAPEPIISPVHDAKQLPGLRHRAETGDANAMLDLGMVYDAGGVVARDPIEAVKWYRKSADAGVVRAMTILGDDYLFGRRTPDYTEAVRWFRKAADAGDQYAMVRLGDIYRDGQGVTQDGAEAVRLFRKAADAGFETAMLELGFTYENGQGVPRDLAESVSWYRKVAASGDVYAKAALKRLGQ